MPKNRLLQSLDPRVQLAISRDLERVNLPRGEHLFAAGQIPEFVYFPTSCLISMVVILESGSTVEAATIGSDGFVGISTYLGMAKADTTAVVQIGGEAQRMRVEAFLKHMTEESFRDSLGASTAKTIATIAQSIACIAFHPVPERLARWLLLVRDGIQQDEFLLTQDFIAVMLGVHRATVTIAVRLLETAGLIEHRRGLIRIVDVAALTEAACECYRTSGLERIQR